MNIEISSYGPPITIEQIRSLEAHIGARLPGDYTEFLLESNGGIPLRNAFPISGLEGNPYGTVQVFFGVGRDIASSNIEWNFDILLGDGIRGLLPIGCTGCGDLLCLRLSGEDAGSVVFWDAHFLEEEPGSTRTHPVSSSFGLFLKDLCDLPTGEHNKGDIPDFGK